ncbi:hypothetical protein HPB50_004319 [Hyalomma asiaticum]|uniref:Uncharacterized protein n=1 Tax=Hyalomma asiaticum TaxID=266040 RepID=A0ACB7RL39_HYAAI|nr:hypothetical protein HPB50_004319 [Hyalomma asiaticum]
MDEAENDDRNGKEYCRDGPPTQDLYARNSDTGSSVGSKDVFHLTAHKKTHESELLPCSMCHKRFFLREDLDKHMRVHTMERPYECDVCGQSFRQLCNMKRHRNMHTGGPQATHACPDCDKTFVEKGHLKSHLRTHTGERPFQCSQCDMRFTEKSSVKKHEQMVHARVFPHYCPHCGKGIANNYKLKRHVHWCQLGTKKEDKEAKTGTTK